MGKEGTEGKGEIGRKRKAGNEAEGTEWINSTCLPCEILDMPLGGH